MEKFRVFIERVERYSHQVVVEASSAREAEKIVRNMDRNNEFENEWNELQPGVETTYDAEKLEEENS